MNEQIMKIAEFADRLGELTTGDVLSVTCEKRNARMDIFVSCKPEGLFLESDIERSDYHGNYYCEAKLNDKVLVTWFEEGVKNDE